MNTKRYLITIGFLLVISTVSFWLFFQRITSKPISIHYATLDNQKRLFRIKQLNLIENIAIESEIIEPTYSLYNIEISPSGDTIAAWYPTQSVKTVIGIQKTKMKLVFLKNDIVSVYWEPAIDSTRYDLSLLGGKTSEYFPNFALWDPTSTFFVTRSIEREENNEYFLLNVTKKQILNLSQLISDLNNVSFSFSNSGNYLAIYSGIKNKFSLVNLDTMNIDQIKISDTYEYDGICSFSWSPNDQIVAFKVGCGNPIEPNNQDLFIYEIDSKTYKKISTIQEDTSCTFFVPGGSQFLFRNWKNREFIIYYLFANINYYNDIEKCPYEKIKNQEGIVIQDIDSNQFVFIPQKAIAPLNLQEAFLIPTSENTFLVMKPTKINTDNLVDFNMEEITIKLTDDNIAIDTEREILINQQLLSSQLYLSKNKKYMAVQNCCDVINFSIWESINQSWKKIVEIPSAIFIDW
jgi:WD40 repeat protein